MRLAFRSAEPKDVDALVKMYDRVYHGGYSACFDKYGPIGPQDFWWVQSEKAVFVIESDHRPVGMIIIGKADRRLLVEELLLGDGGSDESLIQRLHDFLVTHFQKTRQDLLTLRSAESNPVALALARQFEFSFVNALIVASIEAPHPPAEKEAAGRLPAGYAVRRAGPADAKGIARLHEEVLGSALRPAEVERLVRQADNRVFVVERDRYLTGLALAQVKDGVGRWTIGVRETHRRKGVGMALAQAAVQFIHSKGLPAMSTYWALDSAAAWFAQSLGSTTERTFLYFEDRI